MSMRRKIVFISIYTVLLIEALVAVYRSVGAPNVSIASPWFGVLLLAFIAVAAVLIVKQNKTAFFILVLGSIIFWSNFFAYTLPVHISDANMDPGYSFFDWFSLSIDILSGIGFIVLTFLTKSIFKERMLILKSINLKFRYLCIITICFVLLLSIDFSCNKTSPLKAYMASIMIKNYCRNEFSTLATNEGDIDIRSGFTKFSKQRAKEEEEANSFWKGRVVFIDDDPLYVVKSYHIQNVSIEGNKGIAVVVYERLAKTEGRGWSRKLIPDHIKEDKVKIQLIYDKGWWVYDPPPARLSLPTMLAYYTDAVEGLRLPGGDTEQISTYEHYAATYKIVKSLQHL